MSRLIYSANGNILNKSHIIENMAPDVPIASQLAQLIQALQSQTTQSTSATGPAATAAAAATAVPAATAAATAAAGSAPSVIQTNQLDYLNLAGNMRLKGAMIATNFYKDDGKTLSVLDQVDVIKLGLPPNVYYVDKKIGINQQNPSYDLDITGTMGVSGNVIFTKNVLAQDSLAVGKTATFGDNIYLNKKYIKDDDKFYQNPDGQMKITPQGILFGGLNNQRETNSAQISAGTHEKDSLNIIGMSSNTDPITRRIDMWAEGGLTIRGSQKITGDLSVDGKLNFKSMYVRKNNYIFFPEEAIIYHNIFDAFDKGLFVKSGDPSGWDDTSYKQELWNGRHKIRIGNKSIPPNKIPPNKENIYPDGVKITVPDNKTVIWLRALSDRWECFKLYDKNKADLGTFCSGFRKLNKLSPDGGPSDSAYMTHEWIPIPVPIAGEYIICSGNKVNDEGTDCWVSGLAFSTNPWNLALNSGVAYHWIVNGGTALEWGSENWNNDHIAKIPKGKTTTIVVPIVPSGKDKLLYINEHNNNWDGLTHNSISCNDVKLERLRTTWDHPLARHINSKIYGRFVATIIPEILTKDKRFINIKIDLTTMDMDMHIREIGTVDLQ